METLAEERRGVINGNAKGEYIHLCPDTYLPPLVVQSSKNNVTVPVSIPSASFFLPLELVDLLSRFWPLDVRTDN
jgi:hypothetical protein